MKIATRFNMFLSALLVVSVVSVFSFASESDELPANFLAGKHVKNADQAELVKRVHTKQGNLPTPHGFPQGIDTLVNFTHHFEAPGVYIDGSAHHIWEYSMVGNDPARGGTTVINAPVVPVTIDMRDSNGNPRFINGHPLISRPDAFVTPFINGPVFGVASYSSSPDPTQVTDAIQRAEFGNHARADWHTLLAPVLKTPRTMVLTQSKPGHPPVYQFALNHDGTCCRFVLVSDPVFSNELFPPAAPDNSTVIGAAEVAGDITTKDISTFLFPNVYLFEHNDPNQCCVLGFHSIDFEAGDANNGNLEKFFVVNYSSWISPGLFADPNCGAPGGDGLNCFQDITAHSHEIAETFNDPFVGFDLIHNITPWWLSGTPQTGFQCQPLMEVGDVIEVLNNSTVPVTIGGVTYHPQTEALLPWFEFQKNSMAIDHAYSYPNESALTQLSPPEGVGCQ